MSYTRLLAIFQPKLFGVALTAGFMVILAVLIIDGHTKTVQAGSMDKADWAVKPAPSMNSVVTSADGTAITIADFKGAPVLVNFWATWCAPCIDELPALERAANALAPDGIKIMVISIDRGGAPKASPLLDEYGVKTPVAGYDPKARLSREMGVSGLPTSFILSADQQKSWVFVGPFEWDEPAFLDRIRALPLGN